MWRIEATENQYGNVAYVVGDGAAVQCFLADGQGASLTSAGVSRRVHMRCLFDLQDAGDAGDALATFERYGAEGWTYSAIPVREPKIDPVSKAAPDLLAALRLAMATIERIKPPVPHDSTQGTRDVICAAIAKAEGGAA